MTSRSLLPYNRVQGIRNYLAMARDWRLFGDLKYSRHCLETANWLFNIHRSKLARGENSCAGFLNGREV